MHIYSVRWPDLSASLVQPEGEEHLLDILDQVGNADDGEWSIYDGPGPLPNCPKNAAANAAEDVFRELPGASKVPGGV